MSERLSAVIRELSRKLIMCDLSWSVAQLQISPSKLSEDLCLMYGYPDCWAEWLNIYRFHYAELMKIPGKRFFYISCVCIALSCVTARQIGNKLRQCSWVCGRDCYKENPCLVSAPYLFNSLFLSVAVFVRLAQRLCSVTVGSAMDPPTAPTYSCKFCGWQFSEEDGRLHGRTFSCTTCASADRVIRFNVGSKGSKLDSFSGEESCKFFRNVHRRKAEAPNKRLNWTSLRALLVSALTQRRVSSFQTSLTGKELPMSVWLKKGWPQETIEASPNFYSEKHQCQLYTVDIKETKWSEEYQRVESEVLQHESEATQTRHAKKKKRKAGDNPGGDHSSDDEMAVPAGSTAAPEKAEKNPEKLRKQVLQKNTSWANKAAKALGPISQSWTSLATAEEKVLKAGTCVPEGIAESVKKVTLQFQTWSAAARSAVNQHEANKQLSAEDALQPLQELPFTAADVRTVVQQGTEICKSLRALLPPKAPKAKASGNTGKAKAAAAAAEAENGTAELSADASCPSGGPGPAVEPAPKRRRTKTPK